jgi:hypothetical protein
MADLLSEGECLYCKKQFKKSSITTHLNKHLTEKKATGKPGKSFLLKIDTNPKWGVSPYFLQLWVDGNITMNEVDIFLRQIWLECCGHMSSFSNPKHRNNGGALWDFFEAENLLSKGKTKDYEKLMEESNGEIGMSRKTKDVLYKDLKLKHEYDFGSTTELLITVAAEYPIAADGKIILLSRNEPPEILCDSCGIKPATKICTVCAQYDESAFCNNCAKKHGKKCGDFNDYASMPVVNSPRMGVCGYDGGSIDTKRDGVFVKNN